MIRENVFKNLPRVPLDTLRKVSETFGLASVEDFSPSGERDVKGLSWIKVSRSVLMRDSYSCRICGKSDFSSISGKSPHDHIHISVQVHHIIPRKDKGADSFRNLITLCEECHRKTFSEGYSGIPVNYQSNLEWALEKISLCLPIEIGTRLGMDFEEVFISDFARSRTEDNGVIALRIAGQSIKCSLVSV